MLLIRLSLCRVSHHSFTCSLGLLVLVLIPWPTRRRGPAQYRGRISGHDRTSVRLPSTVGAHGRIRAHLLGLDRRDRRFLGRAASI